MRTSTESKNAAANQQRSLTLQTIQSSRACWHTWMNSRCTAPCSSWNGVAVSFDLSSMAIHWINKKTHIYPHLLFSSSHIPAAAAHPWPFLFTCSHHYVDPSIVQIYFLFSSFPLLPLDTSLSLFFFLFLFLSISLLIFSFGALSTVLTIFLSPLSQCINWSDMCWRLR